MKALSIRHPWIDLILAGSKTIEIRTWLTRPRRQQADPAPPPAHPLPRARPPPRLGRLRDLRARSFGPAPPTGPATRDDGRHRRHRRARRLRPGAEGGLEERRPAAPRRQPLGLGVRRAPAGRAGPPRRQPHAVRHRRGGAAGPRKVGFGSMADRYDVIVAGVGGMGSSAAYHL